MNTKKLKSDFVYSYVNLKSKVFMKNLQFRDSLDLTFFSLRFQEPTFK